MYISWDFMKKEVARTLLLLVIKNGFLKSNRAASFSP